MVEIKISILTLLQVAWVIGTDIKIITTDTIIINVTFKNTDNESRTILDGSVHIKYNGTDYNFDKSEPIMADGWGIFLDQINPLTSKTTKLVYKLPTEITGEAYYNPGRSESNQLIDVGSIK